MLNLTAQLKQVLNGATKIVILGIGSNMRADDAAGLLVIQELAQKAKNFPNLVIIDGGTAPENYTSDIRRANPSHLIIVDSAEMGLEPGAVRLITIEESGGFSFNTHALPIKIMVDFLKQDLNLQAYIIGVQPKKLQYGEPVAKEVENGVQVIVTAIQENL